MLIIKKTARILIISFLVMTAGITINSLVNVWHLDYSFLMKEKARILDRAQDLSRQAQAYDEDSVLAGLTKDSCEQFVYRLDDHLRSANIHAMSHKHPKSKCFKSIELNFRNPQEKPLSSGDKNETIASATLHYLNSPDSVLTNLTPLAIDIRELGKVHIRIQLAKSKRLYFGWTSNTAATWKDSSRIHYIKIFTLPGSGFQDYIIDAAALAIEQNDLSKPIRKIFLVPETTETVAISYVRFDAKIAAYVNKGCGVVYEKINNEMRKSLFVESGYEIDFPVKIPKESPCFQFGIGAVNATKPAILSIVLRMPDGEVDLLHEVLSGPATWKNYCLNLSPYSAKESYLSIRSESDILNAVLISNPVLFSSIQNHPFNAMIVVEDSLRADHLSCFGYRRNISPVKEEWAKQGIRFSRAFSQASFTRASCASFLTSLYPGGTGVWTPFDVLDDNYTTLPEILRHQGYATLLISQIVNVSADSGLHQGFDTIIDFRTAGTRASGIYSSKELDQWIANHPHQNKFIYLHVFDPHHPYDPPEMPGSEYYGRPYIGGTHRLRHSNYFDPPWLKQPTVQSRNFLYDEEIRYNDSEFSHLIEILKKNNIYKDTLMIFTADHGEFLGDHGVWGHMPPNLRQVVHVPMIMVYPARFPENRIIDQPVQLLDMAPTILDLASILSQNLLIQGDSLLPLIKKHEGGGDLSSWRRRFCISDEVQYSRKDDEYAYQSIIYENYHILSTNALHDPLQKIMQGISPWLSQTFFQTRVYDIRSDFDEYQPKLNCFFDIFFNYKIQKFARQLRHADLDIWRGFTSKQDTEATIDTDALEQLKTLGYVE